MDNEGTAGELTQCFSCSQLVCGDCMIAIKATQSACPTCRVPFCRIRDVLRHFQAGDTDKYERLLTLVFKRAA